MLCERERPLDETCISALLAVERDAHRTVLGSQGWLRGTISPTMAVVGLLWQKIGDEAQQLHWRAAMSSMLRLSRCRQRGLGHPC